MQFTWLPFVGVFVVDLPLDHVVPYDIREGELRQFLETDVPGKRNYRPVQNCFDPFVIIPLSRSYLELTNICQFGLASPSDYRSIRVVVRSQSAIIFQWLTSYSGIRGPMVTYKPERVFPTPTLTLRVT